MLSNGKCPILYIRDNFDLETLENEMDRYTQILTWLERNEEPAYLYLARRFGLGIQSAQIECSINLDGSASSERTVVIEAYTKIEEIDTFMLFPDADDIIAKLNIVNFSVLDDKKYFGKYKIGTDILAIKAKTKIEIFNSASRMKIYFSPALEIGDRITYILKEEAIGSVFVLANPYDNDSPSIEETESFAWPIFQPTKFLKLAIDFPKYHGPNWYVGEARRASSTGLSYGPIICSELKRLNRPSLAGPDDEGHFRLRFDIEYPMMGLVYLLRWLPSYSKSK
jgi:uncharacterized protein YfkK (UPF0435 family)